jgi:hypothetical protein
MALAITAAGFPACSTLSFEAATLLISRAWVTARTEVEEGVWEVVVDPSGFWVDAATPATAVTAIVADSRILAASEQNQLPAIVGNVEVTDLRLT